MDEGGNRGTVERYTEAFRAYFADPFDPPDWRAAFREPMAQ